MSETVEVVVIATGRKQTIPAKWLDHPVLGVGFKLPPSARKGNRSATPAAAATTEPPATGDLEEE